MTEVFSLETENDNNLWGSISPPYRENISLLVSTISVFLSWLVGTERVHIFFQICSRSLDPPPGNKIFNLFHALRRYPSLPSSQKYWHTGWCDEWTRRKLLTVRPLDRQYFTFSQTVVKEKSTTRLQLFQTAFIFVWENIVSGRLWISLFNLNDKIKNLQKSLKPKATRPLSRAEVGDDPTCWWIPSLLQRATQHRT